MIRAVAWWVGQLFFAMQMVPFWDSWEKKTEEEMKSKVDDVYPLALLVVLTSITSMPLSLSVCLLFLPVNPTTNRSCMHASTLSHHIYYVVHCWPHLVHIFGLFWIRSRFRSWAWTLLHQVSNSHTHIHTTPDTSVYLSNALLCQCYVNTVILFFLSPLHCCIVTSYLTFSSPPC